MMNDIDLYIMFKWAVSKIIDRLFHFLALTFTYYYFHSIYAYKTFTQKKIFFESRSVGAFKQVVSCRFFCSYLMKVLILQQCSVLSHFKINSLKGFPNMFKNHFRILLPLS